MKKNYILTLLLTIITAVSFGQVTNGDFESWTAGVLNTWSSESGTTVEEENTIINGGTSSAKFTVTTQTQSNTDFRQSINVEAGKVYNVSVWVYQADNKARARLFFDGYQGYSDPSNTGAWQEITYDYTATATESIDVGLRFYDTGDWAGGPSIIYIDDYTATEQVATSASITLTSPVNGSNLNPGTTSVNVEWATNGVTSETVDIIVDGTRTSGVSSPFAVTTVDGQSYSVVLELLNGGGVTDSASTNFSIGSISQAADIAALRAGTNNEYYELTGQAIVTYVVGNSRNQIYIQDASGAILIDDNDGTITTALTVGDGITGLKGRLGSFSGISQFVPTEDSGAPTATGQSFTTTSVTMNDFVTNFENYESEWVKIESATFTDANGVAMFDSTTTRNYNITEGADSMVMRIQFDGTNLEGAVIPSGANSITGIAAQFNTTIQIFPIELSGIVLGLGSVNQIEGFGAFPNPVQNKELTISSSSSDAKQVTIYNVLGRKVLSQKFSGTQKTINISSVNTGVYILKVVENGKISTKKLVVK